MLQAKCGQQRQYLTARLRLSDGRRRFLRTLAVLALGPWLAIATADEIWVVARSDAPITALTRDQVADLFLGRWTSSIPLTPFDQDDAELRKNFYRALADLSLQSVRAHWAKRVFTGRGRPPQSLAADQTTAIFGRDPSAVTYLQAGSLPKDAKVILVVKAGETK